jgi:hypothetical protein
VFFIFESDLVCMDVVAHSSEDVMHKKFIKVQSWSANVGTFSNGGCELYR